MSCPSNSSFILKSQENLMTDMNSSLHRPCIKAYSGIPFQGMSTHCPANLTSHNNRSESRQSSKASKSIVPEIDLIRRAKQKWYDIFHYHFDTKRLGSLYSQVTKHFKYFDVADMLDADNLELFISKVLSMFVMTLDTFNDNLSANVGMEVSDKKRGQEKYSSFDCSPFLTKENVHPSSGYLTVSPMKPKKSPVRVDKNINVNESTPFRSGEKNSAKLDLSHPKRSSPLVEKDKTSIEALVFSDRKHTAPVLAKVASDLAPTKASFSPRESFKKFSSNFLYPNTHALPAHAQPRIHGPATQIKVNHQPVHHTSPAQQSKITVSPVCEPSKKSIDWIEVFHKNPDDALNSPQKSASIIAVPYTALETSFTQPQGGRVVTIKDELIDNKNKAKNQPKLEYSAQHDLLTFLEEFRKNKTIINEGMNRKSATQKFTSETTQESCEHNLGGPRLVNHHNQNSTRTEIISIPSVKRGSIKGGIPRIVSKDSLERK